MPSQPHAPKGIRFLGPISFVLRWFCLAVAVAAALAFVIMIGGLSLDAAGLLPKGTESVVVRVGTDKPISITREVASPKADASAPADADGKVRSRRYSERPPLGGASIGGLAVAAGLPLIALVWGLWHGNRLFRRLGKGEYFARPTASALRNFSFGLLAYKVLPLVTLPLFAWFTWSANPGAFEHDVERKASFTLNLFEMDGVLTIIFLGMIVIFAQIMTKAVEIAEDNAQIV